MKKLDVHYSPLFVPMARLVSVTWIVIGLVMIGLTSVRTISGWNSQNWPYVQGKIIASEICPITNSSGESVYYKVRIGYVYSPPSHDQYINSFENYNISFHGFIDPSTNSYTFEAAKSMVQRYEKGKLMRVYYNPNNPKEATLHPGEDFSTWLGSLLGVIAVFLGALLAIFSRILNSRAVVVFTKQKKEIT